MPSNKTSTTTNTYAPGALQNYQQWASQLFPQLSSMFSNPTGSPFFNQQLQQNTKAATQVSGRAGSNALLNFQRSGIGGTSMGGGAYQQLLSGIGRYAGQQQGQAWNNTMNAANQNMWNAGSLGSSFFGNPLVTGGKNVQTQGGVGTWLPQAIGAGVGLATGIGGLGGFGSLLGAGSGQTSGTFQGTNWSQPIGQALNAGNASFIGSLGANPGYTGGGSLTAPGGSSSFAPSGFNPFLPGMGS
jgi:hypothetical protein